MKKPDTNNRLEFFNHTSTTFEVPKNTNLTIIDVFSEEANVKREIIVHENATLNYIKIGKSKENVNVEYTNKIKKDGTLTMSLFEYGNSVNTVTTKLTHENTNFNINGLIDLDKDSKVNYEIKTNHQTKSLSDIKFKNLLDEKSSAKLNMFSIVEETASFSKAFQNSKTILLSDDSFIAVTPHLEISIDELEASHGATSGDLDKDSIYYLESRGINEKNAKIMLLNAIRNEVYANLENEELSEYIKGLL